jgi:predicted unusual protein kinase regulating ubiquinone biosynthesis (AarF/ABC1/UbiB family)
VPASLPPAVRALADAAASLARTAPTTRVALAQLSGLIDPASVPKAIREEVAAELAAAVAGIEPLGGKEAEAILKRAWGAAPAKVLDDFDATPFAVGATSQRHRGELDGDPIEIEVQRPGIAAAIRADLALLDALSGPIRAAFPRVDTGALLREVRGTVLDELDLEHVAGQQRQVARALRRVEGLTVPMPVTEHCAPDVLVAAALDGPTLADATGVADAGAVARVLIAAHVSAARDAGIALTDTRPEDVVLLGDGQVGLRRAGVSATVDPERVALALDTLDALRDDDADAFTGALAEAEVLDPEAGQDAFALARKVLGPLVRGSATLDAAALAAVGERGGRNVGAGIRVAMAVRPGSGDAALARSAGQLVAVLARLEATKDWVALVRAA